MSKMRAFFIGILLLATVVAMVVLSAFIYRTGERSSIKSYIFQMDNNANQRLGILQDINNMSANDLRNKLIKKYVAEYFKVIPGDKDIMNRPTLKTLSYVYGNAFDYWKKTEAKTIEEMSNKNMFRLARVHDDGIATYNKTENSNGDSGTESVYYKVKYTTATWVESNVLETEPIYDQGTLYLEIKFEPGLVGTLKNKRYNLKKYLESGGDPAGLFKFRVINIGDNAKR